MVLFCCELYAFICNVVTLAERFFPFDVKFFGVGTFFFSNNLRYLTNFLKLMVNSKQVYMTDIKKCKAN